MSSNNPGYDLIIVGGGLAGLTAALRSVELGLKTLLFEKGEGEDYPCNSRQSGGILHILFHDPYRPAQELFDFIAEATDGEAQRDLAEALAKNGSRLISWLQSNGARFMRFNQQEGYRWCMAPPRALRAGIDWRGRGPDVVLRQLALKFVERGGTLRLRTRATGLIMEHGVCVGVRTFCDGREERWRAAQCLIADGGFQANPELFKSHIGPSFDAVFQRGARTGMGDGMQMAVAVGAALTETHRFYGHLLCADARSNDNVWPYPELDAIATAGLVVGESGRRIVDEGRSGVYLANALAALPAAGRFHVIFDGAIWEGPGKSARIPANPLLERAGGTVVRADTLEELARKIGIPQAELARTVSEYHAAFDSDVLDTLSPSRSRRIKPWRIAQPPFMAIPAIPGITYTMGGLAIDARARVLDKDGRPIEGLMAAGATTGGLEGGSNAVYIGGLIKAGSFGLIAAENAARNQNRPVPADDFRAEQSASTGQGPGAAGGGLTEISHGLDRFPMLRATLRFGNQISLAVGLVVVAFTLWLGWPPLGAAAIFLAVLLGAGAAVAIRSYTELVKLITELLIPD